MANAPNARQGCRRVGALLTLAAGSLLFAGCTSGVTPTPNPITLPPPSATSHLSTHTGPVQAVTLPPTWTPTFTPSATTTLTPTPVTPTATSTPVPSLADVCDSLSVEREFDDGQVFFWGDTITLFYGTPYRVVRDPATNDSVPVLIRFLATHRASGENLGVQSDGGQISGMQLAANRLATPGYYTWKLAVYGDTFGERCVHEGDFYVYPSRDDLAATAEATAEN